MRIIMIKPPTSCFLPPTFSKHVGFMGFYVGFRTEIISSMSHNGIRKREGPSSLKNDEEDHVMLKKIAALVLSLALCLSLVSFAVAEDVPSLANTDYSYSVTVQSDLNRRFKSMTVPSSSFQGLS